MIGGEHQGVGAADVLGLQPRALVQQQSGLIAS